MFLALGIIIADLTVIALSVLTIGDAATIMGHQVWLFFHGLTSSGSMM